MHIKRTLWICPRCSELKPTRHESVVRHIYRKHDSSGEPISVTTRQTRNQMLASGVLAPTTAPLLRKSASRHGFSQDNFSFTTSDQKNEQGIAPARSSDLSDTFIRFREAILAKDTNEKVQYILNQNSTIISTLAKLMEEINDLKGSHKNIGGELS